MSNTRYFISYRSMKINTLCPSAYDQIVTLQSSEYYSTTDHILPVFIVLSNNVQLETRRIGTMHTTNSWVVAMVCANLGRKIVQ